jgi:DNA-binding response OmpR family regulator
MYHDVVVVTWPDQQEEAERLARLGVPRLLLVERDADPPMHDDLLEDWLRLPADDRDFRARLSALRQRADNIVAPPTIDEHGRLLHRGHWVALGPTIEQLARVFVGHFGEVVTEDDLVAAGWSVEQLHAPSFRGQLHRLRKRMRMLGLEIHVVRTGYLVSERERAEAS